MKNFKVVRGVYPTMITPYKNGAIDEVAVRQLVRFYWKSGCDGIFAVCQSSEIFQLTVEECVAINRAVWEEVQTIAAEGGRRMTVVSRFCTKSAG